MAEPIAALIVRILADTSEMVTGVKNVSGQLDSLENRVGKFGKVLAGVFTVQAAAGFAKEILADINRIDEGAKRLGASTEEFQRFSFAVKQSGGDATAATAGIVSLTDKLGNGDSGLFSVLRKLNINIDEFKAKDAVSRYVDLGTAIGGVSDPAQRLELRLEAMGTKGEKALASINAEFKKLANDAPTYSDETIKSLKRIEDAWDKLWLKTKVGASDFGAALVNSAAQIKDEILHPLGGDGGNPTDPTAPNNQPAGLALPLDPNNIKQVAVALAGLNLELAKVENTTARTKEETRLAKEQFDSMNAVLKMLKMEVGNLAGSMGPLMDAFGTSTKVENMTKRIIDQAMAISHLRAEEERLLELMNPGSTKLAGDGVDAAIFDLRSDPRNFGADGNLTPQALAQEALLIGNANLSANISQMRPAAAPSFPSFGGQFPGGIAPGATNITINAQGGMWDSPDRMNQMARLIEDNIARRSGLSNTYTRR